MSLKKLIVQENQMLAFFASPTEPLFQTDPKKLSSEEKARLASSCSRNLSPECLTMDGEIRGAKLVTKRAWLMKAKEELEALGQTVRVE